MTAPVAVTGAGGKTGRAVIAALARAGHPVRALLRRPDQVPAVRAAGADEIVVGAIEEPRSLRALVDGCAALYHICPNMHPQEGALGEAVLDALRAEGARSGRSPRLVYHSVLRPQIEAMPHHWAKLRVEETLSASGLDWVILQPAPYMQNLLAHRSAIVDEGRYPVPYAVSSRIALVDLDDVAKVAARAVTAPALRHGIFELVGEAAPSQEEVATVLGAAVGRPVRAEAVDRATWAQSARAAGLDGYAVETLLAMFAYYERCGLPGSPAVLTALLGRAPTSLAAFAARAPWR